MTIDANAADSSSADTIEDVVDAPADTAAATDANATISSDVDAEDANEAPSLLSVIQDAVKKPDAEADSSAAVGEGEADAEAAAETVVDANAQAEADAKLPFHEHPRWKEVIAERDSFKEDAGRFRNISGFMDQHGLSGEEVAEGFDVMAKLKSRDPKTLAEARAYFQDGLTRLDAVLGNVLPDDLREKVEAGLIDEEDAQELAKTRASDALKSEQLKARETADADAEARTQAAGAAKANAEAVESWEVKQKAADPDYTKKAKLVEKTCFAIVSRTGKVPTTPAEAVALCDEALKEVNAELAAMLPRRKPVATSPVGSAAPTVAQPKTLGEAIRASIRS